jgi:HlyD family type I secretion membrane fusion protein
VTEAVLVKSHRPLSRFVVEPPVVAAENPRKEIKIGIAILVAFFVIFLGWSAFARLDVAATGQGVVTVSGASQAVQHRDGGIVRAINVHEGDHVRAGQPLIELAADEARGAERALFTRLVFRTLEVTRLAAEITGGEFAFPSQFSATTGDDRALIDAAFANAQSQLKAQRVANTSRRSALSQRMVQAQQQIAGSQMQMNSSVAQQQLTQQELESVKRLQAEGYAPANRVRALEKNAAALAGDVGAKNAEIAGLKGAIGETASNMARDHSERAVQVADELRTAEADLQSVQPQWEAARDALDRMTIRAPVDGDIVGLTVNTIGGVIAPGQAVMSVVPRNAPLVVEARFLPQDVDGLTVGRSTEIRFPGIHDRSMPLVHGVLTRLSADTVADPRSGQRYYTAEVTVPYSQLAKIKGHEAEAHTLRPGQTAQVLVPLRRRTALQYWLEPFVGIFWGALAER